MEDRRIALTHKILLTGQASLADTICAITDVGLDRYVTRPQKAPEFREVVCSFLTDHIELVETGPMPYLGVLDPQRTM